jgi:uncharacterized membrane protein YebE (DUF533 family)
MNAERILSQILSGGAGAGLAGGLASGLLTSKAGSSLGKSALELGGVAAVAGLAYTAFQRWRDAAGASPGAGAAATAATATPRRALKASGFLPAGGAKAERELGGVLLRAMIAATRADGRPDAAERGAIFGRVAKLDLAIADKVALWEQLNRPVELESLAQAATTPERAAEIYAATLLAIEVDTAEERAWLAQLAARLGLPAELVAALHREAGVAPAAGSPPEVARSAAA